MVAGAPGETMPKGKLKRTLVAGGRVLGIAQWNLHKSDTIEDSLLPPHFCKPHKLQWRKQIVELQYLWLAVLWGGPLSPGLLGGFRRVSDQAWWKNRTCGAEREGQECGNKACKGIRGGHAGWKPRKVCCLGGVALECLSGVVLVPKAVGQE